MTSVELGFIRSAQGLQRSMCVLAVSSFVVSLFCHSILFLSWYALIQLKSYSFEEKMKTDPWRY